jgi:tetratricopeptide (TPR) repeat protein
MKSLLLLVVGLGIGLAGGVLFFRSQPTPTTPLVESIPAPVASEKAVAIVPNPPPVIAATKLEPAAPTPATPAVVPEPEPESAAAFRKSIDALLAPQTSLRQKYRMFRQFSEAGQMDQVIAELKQRATLNPADPTIPATLGEALLDKVRVLHESGADVNEVGILAMQADQSFNAALKADPTNWEAQFVKYSTMYYWPADAARDNDVAQKLSSLIDQQEALPSQPQFVQTYIALGNQYQKLGKPDFAEATWRLGLTKFPNDPTLLKKLAPQ